MRRLLEARGAAGATAGVLVVLAAGSGYALASSGNRTIHACVHRHGGGIYIAKKCAKHDRKLSLSQVGPRGPAGQGGATGPQGPGASYLVYSAAGGSSSNPTTIGTVGPFTFSGVCTQSGGTTTATIEVTESGARVDGLIVSGNTALSLSGNLGALSDAVFDNGTSTSSTPEMASSDELVIPLSGTAVQLQQTFSVVGGATNTCHFSATATPTGLAGSVGSATASAHGSLRSTPAPGHGAASPRAGLVIAGERIG